MCTSENYGAVISSLSYRRVGEPLRPAQADGIVAVRGIPATTCFEIGGVGGRGWVRAALLHRRSHHRSAGPPVTAAIEAEPYWRRASVTAEAPPVSRMSGNPTVDAGAGYADPPVGRSAPFSPMPDRGRAQRAQSLLLFRRLRVYSCLSDRNECFRMSLNRFCLNAPPSSSFATRPRQKKVSATTW